MIAIYPYLQLAALLAFLISGKWRKYPFWCSMVAFGLPLAVQLIGPLRSDDQLIAWARWVEQRLS